jgi:hypothetical protein
MDSEFVTDFVAWLDADAKRIEAEKNGRALTPKEAETLKAAQFMRQIAPYMFAPDDDAEAPATPEQP